MLHDGTEIIAHAANPYYSVIFFPDNGYRTEVFFGGKIFITNKGLNCMTDLEMGIMKEMAGNDYYSYRIPYIKIFKF